MGKTVFLETFSYGGSRDTLHYCQGLIETLKKTKLVTSFFYSFQKTLQITDYNRNFVY